MLCSHMCITTRKVFLQVVFFPSPLFKSSTLMDCLHTHTLKKLCQHVVIIIIVMMSGNKDMSLEGGAAVWEIKRFCGNVGSRRARYADSFITWRKRFIY